MRPRRPAGASRPDPMRFESPTPNGSAGRLPPRSWSGRARTSAMRPTTSLHSRLHLAVAQELGARWLRPEKSPWCVAAWHRHRDRRLSERACREAARSPAHLWRLKVWVGHKWPPDSHLVIRNIPVSVPPILPKRQARDFARLGRCVGHNGWRPRQGHGVVGARTDTSARVWRGKVLAWRIGSGGPDV